MRDTARPTALQYCLPSSNISLVSDFQDKVTSLLNSHGISVDVYTNLYTSWEYILAYVSPHGIQAFVRAAGAAPLTLPTSVRDAPSGLTAPRPWPSASPSSG